MLSSMESADNLRKSGPSEPPDMSEVANTIRGVFLRSRSRSPLRFLAQFAVYV